jgi:hypothetical protein
MARPSAVSLPASSARSLLNCASRTLVMKFCGESSEGDQGRIAPGYCVQLIPLSTMLVRVTVVLRNYRDDQERRRALKGPGVVDAAHTILRLAKRRRDIGLLFGVFG